MRKHMVAIMLVSIILGFGIGFAIYELKDFGYLSGDQVSLFAKNITLLSTLFLHMIKMIIGPLVITTLVVGIAHLGDASSVGRLFGISLLWFVAASLISLTLGLLLVNLIQPGVGLDLPLPDVGKASGIATSNFTFESFIEHLVPTSVFESLAKNDILQIVVFSIFFGVALASMGARGKLVTQTLEQASHVMLIVTGYVMKFAPIAVFAAVAATVSKTGFNSVKALAWFMGGFYVSLGILWAVLIAAGFLFLGPRIFRLLGLIREPMLLAFSTASSEAAYPKTLERLEQFGVPNRIASFVLPVGYSFNLDGSMMYCTFASLFVAQIYNIHLDIGTQISMLILLMLTSKGMAGVPRASLVVVQATLGTFHIPEAGLLLIITIDQFLDMGRSATNVVGNSLATAVVAKLEGQLRKEMPGVDAGKTLEESLLEQSARGL